MSVALDRAPNQLAFTLDECHQWAKDAGLSVKRESVRLDYACQSGELDKVFNDTGIRNAARYARPGVGMPAGRQKTLAEWAAEIFADSDRDLTPTAILVRMVDRCYVLHDPRKEAVRYLGWALEKYTERFSFDEGDWRLSP